mmetsp:Transcript_24980/g.68889  ORF Transcript_24980/g.68889 Transcript_24980/m.68889 type:complete len:326 (-) Transcript_24980:114-1091(-)
MVPCGIGDQVSCPAVRNLVSDNVGQRFIPGQQGRRDKGEARVFHSSVWETRRQTQQIVAAPGVLPPGNRFGGGQEHLRLAELVGRALDDARLAPDGASFRNGLLGQFPDRQGEKVRTDGNGLFPVAHLVGSALRCRLPLGQGGHDAGGPSGNGSSSRVGHLHPASILAGDQRAGVDCLALCEEIGVFLSGRLGRGEPLEGAALVRGGIDNRDFAVGFVVAAGGQVDFQSASQMRFVSRDRMQGEGQGISIGVFGRLDVETSRVQGEDCCVCLHDMDGIRRFRKQALLGKINRDFPVQVGNDSFFGLRIRREVRHGVMVKGAGCLL